jgi:uncharacterized protein (TIGR00725 family)
MKVEKGREVVYSICVSGAAEGITVADSSALAKRLGIAIAKAGQTIVSGATIGLPYVAAKAASDAGGKSIGFSPAVSLREHLRKYRLPYNGFDFINFTGMNYVGRDLYLVQSSDAVITIGGRFGSLHEFTSALEDNKPCGILLGSGGTADLIPELMEKLDAPRRSLVVYSHSPEELVSKIIKMLDVTNKDLKEQLEKYDEYWFLDERRGHKHSG